MASEGLMMLVEEGKIQTDDPLALCLPEFKDLEVGNERVAPKSGRP